MVKNKGFLPSWPSEVKVQRKQLKSIIFSTWDACTSPDWESNGKNFIAEAIIANPPAYGHIHVAERLKIPLHLIFTMPWSPTGAFPHPLARLTQYAGFENRLSYAIVDSITWLGVRDIINSFRTKKLKLAPISLTDRWSSSMLHTNKVPFAYIWSPSLVPKPKDWGSYIDVVGFCFLNLANAYKPPEDLEAFLKEGPPPVFIGFGSLPVGDPQKMTAIIFEALRKTGMRGIVQKGWGGLGEGIPNPPSVYIVGNCPHDWLFPQCAAVVHHGGAGTTAAGLLAECPTTVVPFFGDQPFWGDAVFTQGVGPKAIPVGDFSLDRLVKALEFMARPEVKEAAITLADKMRLENGVEGAVHAFHKHLPKDVKNGRKMLWGLTRKRAAKAKRQPACGCFG